MRSIIINDYKTVLRFDSAIDSTNCGIILFELCYFGFIFEI